MSGLSSLILNRTLARYLAGGVLNTFSGLAVIYLLKWLTESGDVQANLCGYAAGLILSFAVNAKWTFEYDGPILRAVGRFFVVIGIAYIANLAVVLASIHILGINTYFAQALGVLPYVAIGYLGSKFFAFRKSDYRH